MILQCGRVNQITHSDQIGSDQITHLRSGLIRSPISDRVRSDHPSQVRSDQISYQITRRVRSDHQSQVGE
uniref:Uncharacterized protein n=1 Tax=Globodera rostochiensis TaxID=31243 RepID=A0A914H0A6_GLORO